MTFLPFVLMIVVVWFLFIRPAPKQKEHQSMLTPLTKNDRVVTSSGSRHRWDGNSIVVLKVNEEPRWSLKSAIAGKPAPNGEVPDLVSPSSLPM
jgi:preprotein translocase YajC subunit